MAQKKTVGQKREIRLAEQARTPIIKKAGGDRIDTVIAEINQTSQHGGRVMRGAQVVSESMIRRVTPIPSLNYILGGGLKRGGIHEFGGEYSSGKTTLAIQCCAEVQRTEREQGPAFGAVFWCAIEPFSKRYARENGFFIPFCEDLVLDQTTGEMVPSDPFSAATETELLRMKEAGIEDPYTEVTPVVIYQEERGDVALDNVIKAIRSNQFAMVVVDSLGAAKSSAWLYEKDVQDFSDYDRSPKMIGDYTARALTTCNARYDENNILCKDGEFSNQTTVINIAQIYTNIGSQAHSPWKQYSIKGGEGSKHNHHAIVYVWKGEQLRQEKALAEGRPYIYGGEIKMICIKSKICPPWRQGAVRFYFDNFEEFRTGSMDVARDLLGLALQAGTIQARGSHYYVGEEPIGNGKDAASAYLRGNKEWFDYIHDITRKALA